MIEQRNVDAVIIGGGINGCGIAAHLSLQGLRIALCDKNDLGGATSSSSSKLIHGGLRYLEQYNFKLVKQALKEREILLNLAPHIISPLKFVLPYDSSLRPKWLIRFGLWLYDHLNSHQTLPRSQYIRNIKEYGPLRSSYQYGFSFYDCLVDDARLVILNALQAKNNGAFIYPRTTFVKAERYANQWRVIFKNSQQKEYIFECKLLINAAGPWVNEINHQLNITTNYTPKLIKGSHIIVPKFYEKEHAFILQNTDKRVIFVIPYQQEYCIIGTTEVLVQSADHSNISPSNEEIEYLLKSVNRYFTKTLSFKDILHTYAGIRPLYDDASDNVSSITRNFMLHLDSSMTKAPILTVHGGKITTYRKLAETVGSMVKPLFSSLKHMNNISGPLPGGHFSPFSINQFIEENIKRYASLKLDSMIERICRTYGSQIDVVLKDVKTDDDLGRHFGYGLYEKEIRYLIEYEWALSCEDILWRRTKLGLKFNQKQEEELHEWLQKNLIT